MTGAISNDLSRFNQVFFEESAEHLTEMERILLELDPDSPQEDDLHAIFRAAHSIKGSAGIFGFTDMTVVTHDLESLLDRVRNHELTLSRTMIDAFLEAGDAIAMQLAGHRDGSAVDLSVIEEVCKKLGAFISETSDAAVDAGSGLNNVFSTLSDADAPSGVAAHSNSIAGYEIDFEPAEDTFKRGVRLENLFYELADLGELQVSAYIDFASPFSELDPEKCYTRWHLFLETAAGVNELRDIFEFVAEENELKIGVVSEAGAAEVSDNTAEPGQEHRGNGVMAVKEVCVPMDAQAPVPGRRAYDRNETAAGAYGRRAGESAEGSSIRVGVAKVDQLINQVGELVITQSMLSQIVSELDPVLFENIHRGLMQLERNTRDMQESIMSIRLVPISLVFSRFPRLVRDLSAKLGKLVELKTFGETTELDKGLIEKIADPLTHLVRNCLDHAIELPHVRTAEGKDATGTITMRAAQVGGRIVIDVADDGAGLNRDKILKKALERGLDVDDTMPDEEVWHLIFAPGFSTADTVTDISGRGVGMDVVQKNVHAMGGRIHVASEQGKGCKFTISLPLTLAILDGLSVAVGKEKFIIPLNSIVESLQPLADDIKMISGRRVVHVRGEYLPLLPLYEVFNLETSITKPEEGILVLIDAEGERGALMVDELIGEHQVVIKSLENNYRKVEGTAGATILGDGRVALILDVGGLLQAGKNAG